MDLACESEAVRRFMWAVQALALGADEQRQLFPGFTDAADELALEHEETQAAFLKVARPLLSSQQHEVVRRLDQQLERISGPENMQLWTVEGLTTAPEWDCVRDLAATVLREMGWPCESPPRDRAIYVGPPSD